MIVYQPTDLRNLFIREQAAMALDQRCLLSDEYEGILKNYPLTFYSPNLFIRIGLFILTLVITVFSFGLLLLLVSDSAGNAMSGIALFFGMLAYAALEYMVQNKHHFQSGVDDALMWTAAAALFGGTSYLCGAGDIGNCILLFLIALYCAIRFADRLMGIGAYIALLGIFFFAAIKIGPVVKAYIPFMMMGVSAFVYLFVKKFKPTAGNHLYAKCLQVIAVAALLGFYTGGNYYVVRELSNELFHLNLGANETIPFGWLCWIFTFAIPVIYLARGIQKKDMVFIRVSLLLLAAAVFTLRYYHTIAPLEIVLTLGGGCLILAAYGLTLYLKTPRQGFTNIPVAKTTDIDKLQIESLLIAETFNGPSQPVEGQHFGGGSFGGGGASGDF
jgi:uncharacterized membrane protein YgcG